MKKYLILGIFLISFIHAQNVLGVLDTEASPGDTNVAVSVILKNPSNYVSGIQFTLHFDQSIMELVDVQAGQRLSGTGFSLTSNSLGDSVNVVIISMSGDSLPPDSGELVVFHFNVLENLSEDSVLLMLSRVVLSSPGGDHLPVEAEGGVFRIIVQPRAFIIALADTVSIGNQVELPLVLRHPNDAVSGFQFTLLFDATKVTFDSLISLLPGNFTYSVNSYGDSVKVVFISLSGDSIVSPPEDTLIGKVKFNLNTGVVVNDSIPVQVTGVVIANPQAQHVPSAGADGYIGIAPNSPVIIRPNGYVNSRSLGIVWTSVAGGAWYIVEVSDTNDFSTLIDSAEVIDTIHQINVTNDGVYYARVLSESERGYKSEWSEIDSFTVDATPPGVVTLIGPPDGAMLNNNTVEIIWGEACDNLSGISGYWLEIGVDSANFGYSVFVSDTDTVVMLSDSVWYWRVKAVDVAGNEGGWSEVRMFEVDTHAPEVPTLVSPVDSIWLTYDTVNFIWSRVVFKTKKISKSTPVRYVLKLDNNVIDSAISDTSYTIQVPEGLHTWRIRAYDLAGNSSNWSNPGYFGVDITSPVIDSMTVISDTVRSVGPWTIHTWIRDNVSGVDSVLLFYQMDPDTQWQEVVMSDSSNGEWIGEIPELMDTFAHSIRYFTKAKDHAGNIALSDTLNFVAIDVEESEVIPGFKLLRVNSVMIRVRGIRFEFEIPRAGMVNFTIYNVTGRKMWKREYFLNRGHQVLVIKPTLRSGLYFLRIRYGGRTYTRKLLVIPTR